MSGSRDSVLEYLSMQDIPDPCLREKLNEVNINTILTGTLVQTVNNHAGCSKSIEKLNISNESFVNVFK